MKPLRIIAMLALCVTLAASAMAQGFTFTSAGSDISKIGGRVFYAQEYNLRSAHVVVVGGNSLTGSQSITLSTGSVKLQDGRAVVPFAVNVPITIADANQETVTITAVSNCVPTGQIQDPFNTQATLCTVTASFANTHGAGAVVLSGDGGFLSAMNDAGNTGGGQVFWSYDCGNVTLNTGGATTTISTGPCALIPKAWDNGGASVYVKTTITTSASYSVGITSSTAAFITSCTSLTAATNCALFQTGPAGVAVATTEGTTLITANAAAGAGVVHLTVWGWTAAQATY